MNSIQQNLNRPNDSRKSVEELRQEMMSDSDIATFIRTHQLTSDQVTLSLTKFYEYLTERKKYQESTDRVAYRPILMMNEGYADVSYQETQELVDYRQKEAIKNRIQLRSLPHHLKTISSSDLDFTDRYRLELYQKIEQFVTDYPAKKQGFYVYGNFGIGKSYLMAYLAHRLSESHGQSTILVHYPTFVVEIKNAIKDGSVKDKIDELKQISVLVLDDIGAEQHSPWVRDDVLQVILQHRMQENLSTFFTSNFSFADLERHFATGKSGDETWQAKRVMERIRFLSTEIHLEGVNRRHE